MTNSLPPSSFIKTRIAIISYFQIRRDHIIFFPNFLWAPRFWVRTRYEPVLGYISKIDGKQNSWGKGLLIRSTCIISFQSFMYRNTYNVNFYPTCGKLKTWTHRSKFTAINNTCVAITANAMKAITPKLVNIIQINHMNHSKKRFINDAVPSQTL